MSQWILNIIKCISWISGWLSKYFFCFRKFYCWFKSDSIANVGVIWLDVLCKQEKVVLLHSLLQLMYGFLSQHGFQLLQRVGNRHIGFLLSHRCFSLSLQLLSSVWSSSWLSLLFLGPPGLTWLFCLFLLFIIIGLFLFFGSVLGLTVCFILFWSLAEIKYYDEYAYYM